MSVDIISPGSRCWLHPGERVIGVCATCLKQRLGRLAFLPSNTHNVAPRFSFDASFLPRRDVSLSQPRASIVSALIESDAENCEDGCAEAGRSTIPYLLKSRSLSLAKNYSFSSLGAENGDGQASKEEGKSVCGQPQIADARFRNGGCISRERKTLKDLFVASDGSEYAVRSSISSRLEAFSSDKVGKEYEHTQGRVVVDSELDPFQGEGEAEGGGEGKAKEVSEVSQSIASMIKQELHSRRRSSEHGAVPKQQMKLQSKIENNNLVKITNIVKDPASSFHSPLISNSSLTPLRSCMTESSRVEINRNVGRSRSIPTTGGSNPAADLESFNHKEIRDSTKNVPTIKQVNPLIQNGQDLKVNLSDPAKSKSDNQKTISCLVALDLHENKKFPRSHSSRASVWIKTFSAPMQALKSRKSKKDQCQLKQNAMGFQKAKGIRPQSMADEGKTPAQDSPLPRSQDHSFLSFYISPLRRSQRKWTEKFKKHGRDTINSSPSTVGNNSPWSFYLTPLRYPRRNKVKR